MYSSVALVYVNPVPVTMRKETENTNALNLRERLVGGARLSFEALAFVSLSPVGCLFIAFSDVDSK